MTPEELAKLHPQLFHVTRTNVLPLIEKHGLLSTNALLDLFEVEQTIRDDIAQRPRKAGIQLSHRDNGVVWLNDQAPLNLKKLAKCLDDDLTPLSWLDILNSRVYLWADKAGLERLKTANVKRRRKVSILTINTLRFAEAFIDQLEISPINSGATLHQPAHRGLSTFAKINELDFQTWRNRRRNLGYKNSLDTIKEVTVIGLIYNFTRFVDDIQHVD